MLKISEYKRRPVNWQLSKHVVGWLDGIEWYLLEKSNLMGKIIDKVGVTVSDQSLDNNTRHIAIEIKAEASLFSLSDILAREEALEPLLPLLKRNTKQLVTDYIQNAKHILKAAALSKAAPKPGLLKKAAAGQSQ